jgi:Fic family protein
LHRENRVRTIYSSLAIEGNSLTLGEVTSIIDGKVVAGKQTYRDDSAGQTEQQNAKV